MSTDVEAKEGKPRKTKIVTRGGSSAVYGLGIFGAWYYYLTTATSFGMGLLGLLKGIFWPALVVYETMKYLGM